MKDFDNFKYYFDHKDKFESQKPVQTTDYKSNGENLSYTLDESYLAQMFYWRYFRLFGRTFLSSCINTMSLRKKRELERMILLSEDFEEDCKGQFIEMCDELGVQINNEFIQQNIPFDWRALEAFIHNSGEESLIDNMALLISFDQFQDGGFDYGRVAELLSSIRKTGQVRGIAVYKIRQKALSLCKTLFGKTEVEKDFRNLTIDKSDFPTTGSFYLPWKYVEFMDNVIFLYHPHEYGQHSTHPLVVKNAKSRVAMNSIKRYLDKAVCEPYVHAFNGRLDKLYYEEDLLDGIEILHQRLHSDAIAKKQSPSRPFHKNMPPQDMKQRLRELKSKYLDFLCDAQLPDYPIVYCPENRINGDNVQFDEDSFIFVIRQTKYRITLVFENTLESRASYVVRCRKLKYDSITNLISRYFASDAVNKREHIGELKNELATYGASFRKVFHDDFNLWKNSILNI